MKSSTSPMTLRESFMSRSIRLLLLTGRPGTGQELTVNQSHAGSSKQARSILEGLEADVVTFNQVVDVQVLHDKGNLIPADWRSGFPIIPRLIILSRPFLSAKAIRSTSRTGMIWLVTM